MNKTLMKMVVLSVQNRHLSWRRNILLQNRFGKNRSLMAIELSKLCILLLELNSYLVSINQGIAHKIVSFVTRNFIFELPKEQPELTHIRHPTVAPFPKIHQYFIFDLKNTELIRSGSDNSDFFLRRLNSKYRYQ